MDLLNRRGIQAHATITMSLEEFTDTMGSALDDKILLDAQKRGIVTLGPHKYANLANCIEITMCSSSRPCRKLLSPNGRSHEHRIAVIASDTPVNLEICARPLFISNLSVQGIADRIEDE